ncbi:MAG: FixH family protein [Alphaproteobacteria bacterium]|nr:FixH family protein [Alphaproteobacteria bacterium]
MSDITVAKPITGKHIAWMFIAFFGVIFAVNILMAVIAVKSWTGLVVENSYLASQQFNADVQALRKSEALGLSHVLHYANGKLLLTVTGANGQPLNTPAVKISIGRPVDNGEDQTLTATATADHAFIAETTLGSGVWTGELSAKMPDGQTWRRPFKLVVEGK